MALKKQLDAQELALLEVIEDDIYLGQFLRSTADGSSRKEEWPKREFNYRWYQKDLLTDKNEFISLTGGRAIGKCHPASSRIFTYPYGYRKVGELWKTFKDDKNFVVYSLTKKGILEQRKAKMFNNGMRGVYRIRTHNNNTVLATANHPFLTPDGYKTLGELVKGDRVAVVTELPHESMQRMFTWEEMRFLGYIFWKSRFSPETPIAVRYQRQTIELKAIADYFDAHLRRLADGTFIIKRKTNLEKHYGSVLLYDILGQTHANTYGLSKISQELKGESKESVIVFVEALLSVFATFDAKGMTITTPVLGFVQDLQEMLLYLKVRTIITEVKPDYWELRTLAYEDYHTMLTTLDVPGLVVKNLRPPIAMRGEEPYEFEEITEISLHNEQNTFGIHVFDEEHNYIADNFIVHNSIILEDMIVNEAVNADLKFPDTKEQTLVTANYSQMTPLLDHLILRFSNSPFLKSFLGGQVNKSKGTLDFKTLGSVNYRLNARIAGSKGEQNMVGLHVPMIKGDEMQIFPMASFIQLGPTYNSWESGRRQFYCGVPNGLREGSVLYYLDQRSLKYKKYRIPAHENPYFTATNNIEAIKQYSGEDSEDYQHLVLGRHGEAAYAVIPRDKIRTEPFEFFSYRYSQTDKQNHLSFKEKMALPRLPEKSTKVRVLAIDTGYTDPTVMHIMGRDDRGIWRSFVRYRVTRIPFPEQADIISWLDDFYGFNSICIDLGAGGGGIGVTQDLMSPRFSQAKSYAKRIHGVRFADNLAVGRDPEGNDIKTQAKSFAGQELARIISEGQLIFSEIDQEGLSQLERITYQRRPDGSHQYFVLSERGVGKSSDDHIFASYLVFIISLITASFQQEPVKLFRARWM